MYILGVHSHCFMSYPSKAPPNEPPLVGTITSLLHHILKVPFVPPQVPKDKDGVTYIITAPEENAGIELICDVLSEMYVEQKVAYPKTFTKDVKKFVPSGIHYPKDNKDAKGAFRGWLGSLASKWKRLKMQSSATIELAGNLAKAMGLNDIPVEKLKEKLAIKKL